MSKRALIITIAALVVAGPRYIAIGGQLLNTNVFFDWPIIGFLEKLSWIAFAILEAFSFAFIAEGLRAVGRRSLDWWQLLITRYILLLAIPVLGVPLYAAVAADTSVAALLPLPLYAAWLFFAAGLPALVLFAVGIADQAIKTAPTGAPAERADVSQRAWGLLSMAHGRGEYLTPPALASALDIDEVRAMGIIRDWYESLPKRPGVKPKHERALVAALNGGG